MSDNPFDDFFDDDLAQAIKEVEEGGFGPYEKPPYGKYTVFFEDLKYGTSNAGNPKATFRFRISGGEYDGKVIFHTVTLASKTAKNPLKSKALGIHRFRTILKDMMVFDAVPEMLNKGDFDAVLEKFDEIDFMSITYSVDFQVDSGGYDTLQIFDVASV